MALNLSAILRLLAFFIIECTHLLLCSCNKNAQPAEHSSFDSIPVIRPVVPLIAEASGMVDGRKNKSFLWVHEDSGNPAVIYLLGHDGKVVKTVPIKGTENRDWEEMQYAGSQIYLADIGDNQDRYSLYRIYIFDEPEPGAEEVAAVQTLRFVYEDGPHDAEAFLVDAATKDIYLFTKTGNPSKIYTLSYPYSFTSINTAHLVGELAYAGVVGATQSADGKEVIIKTYARLHYYTRSGAESLLQVLHKPAQYIPYRVEPQGEAVAFAVNGKGYFTLSEKGLFNSTSLYWYPRK